MPHFRQAVLDIPGTLEEFEALMQTVKDAGYEPVSVGGRTGWPLEHVWSQLSHTNADLEVFAELEQLNPDFSYTDPRVVESAERFGSWCDLGFFNQGALGTSYQEANDLFINREVAMNIGGSWAAVNFEQADFEVGFFATPQMNPELPWNGGGQAPANNLTVTVYAEHPEWAIELIDYLLSEENMTTFFSEGMLVDLPPLLRTHKKSNIIRQRRRSWSENINATQRNSSEMHWQCQPAVM